MNIISDYLKKSILIITFFIFLFPSLIYGQEIYAYKLNDLDFGDVFIGYSTEVLHTDLNAAKFMTKVRRRRNDLQITFTLPANLTYNNNSIPIIFDYSHSAWSLSDQITGRENFDPEVPLVVPHITPNREVFLWLGGILNTPNNIPPGIYQGTIVMTVEIL